MKGINQGQHVTLKVGEQEHAARVEQVGEGHLVLGLARAPEEPLVAGAEAMVETTDHRGLHLVNGALDPDKREPDVVTLRWQAVENIQRREFVRVEVLCVVEVRREEKPPISTYTVNVSGSGFLLAGPDDLELGDRIEVAVELNDDEQPLVAAGEVVRITGEGHRGVHIEEISEADRERLIHYVFERQRTAPRVRLA